MKPSSRALERIVFAFAITASVVMGMHLAATLTRVGATAAAAPCAEPAVVPDDRAMRGLDHGVDLGRPLNRLVVQSAGDDDDDNDEDEDELDENDSLNPFSDDEPEVRGSLGRLEDRCRRDPSQTICQLE